MQRVELPRRSTRGDEPLGQALLINSATFAARRLQLD
jgi:hypothetical protein